MTMHAEPLDTFGLYSRYYDLFYADKDYAAEARFVDGMIRERLPDANTLLEIGCGTGRHARHLTDFGYRVHGIDLSDEMLASIALEGAPETFTFCVGDARSYRGGRTYDAVVALFHVMSYLPTRDDLAAGIATAAAHLVSGGVFVFDAWYGPAVLTQHPEERERTVEADDVVVRRTATPTMYENEQRVDVAYHIEVSERARSVIRSFDEVHRMRYLFTDEVAELLDAAGLELAAACEFGTGGDLGLDTWNACFVGRKR